MFTKMKKLLIIALCVCLFSCSAQKHAAPTYKIEKETFDSIAKADTTARIAVYNVVVPQPEEKKGVSDETFRMFISEFFSTIAAIFAIFSVETSN
jgi:uncharacterized lipoprotein YmbA